MSAARAPPSSQLAVTMLAIHDGSSPGHRLQQATTRFQLPPGPASEDGERRRGRPARVTTGDEDGRAGAGDEDGVRSAELGDGDGVGSAGG